MGALRASFRPEFLNRVDDIVIFKPLSRGEVRQIVRLLLQGLAGRLAERQITLRTDDDAVDFIADAGYDPVYGARPLKRYLVRNVETKLARALIAGDVRDGATVTIGVGDGDGALKFTFEQGPRSAVGPMKTSETSA